MTAIELSEYIKLGQVPPELVNSVKLSVNSTFAPIFNKTPDFNGVDIITKLDKFDGIIGVVSFVGDLAWSLSLGLNAELAAIISKKFFGMDIDYNGPDMGDMIGEFVNIIGGDVLARLDSINIKAEMSIPTATRGQDIALLFSEKLPLKQMHFKSPGGNFWIKLAIDKHKHKNQKFDHSQLKDERQDMSEINMGNEFTDAYVDCVKQSIQTTFNTICEEQPKFMGNVNGHTLTNGIVGIISLLGGDKSWSIMLGFSKESALTIGQKFAGFKIEYESEDMGDVIGELANVVGGDIIARLDAMGIKADLSIPTIARGHEMEMLLSHNVTSLQQEYSLSLGKFWVKLAVSKNN
jgi:chemotaxis protein CheX